jgi:VWFA-related protein
MVAQQAAAEVPVPTIRANTRLVLVDVVVTDKQGKPVQGLHPEDFVVEENGKKQKVSTFSSSQEAAKVAAAPALPTGIYSNRPEYRSPGGPVTVLLLDAINTPFKDQAYARSQMIKYVKEQIKPGERIGVFTLTNSLNVLQDFTSDPQALLAALQSYRPQEPVFGRAGGPAVTGGTGDAGGAAVAVIAAMAASLRSFEGEQVAYSLDRRVEITLQSMRGLSRILGGIPGRKNILWLTAAFPFSLIPEDRNISEAELIESLPNINQKGVGTHSAGSVAAAQRLSHSDEIRQAATQLANAQVAIYPIDVRGLVSGAEATFQDLPSREDAAFTGGAIVRMSDVTASQETMREMARETGGRAYVNQNDIKEGVALALADDKASYTLGYYPENKKWDGKYRNIKVKLNRDGTEVRHRRGFFAIDPGQGKDKSKSDEQQVAEAITTAAPATLVAFSARVRSGAANQGGKGKVGVDFLVDAHTLSAEDASGGAKKVSANFYAALFSGGKMINSQSFKVDTPLSPEDYQQVLQHGLLFHADLDPRPGTYELRLAVRDNRTGYVGTTSAPLTVPLTVP